MLKKVLTIASFPVFLAIARLFPWERVPSPCVFWRVTGLPCPSCGMTRSVVALTHLDFARAAYMNPLGIAFVAVFGVWWGHAAYEVTTGRRTGLLAWTSRKMTALAVAAVAVLFIYGGTRIAWLLRR